MSDKPDWTFTPIGKLFHEYEVSMGEAGARTRLVKAISELHMMFSLPPSPEYATKVVSAVARLFLPPAPELPSTEDRFPGIKETLAFNSLSELLVSLIHADGYFRVCALHGKAPDPAIIRAQQHFVREYISRGGDWS